MAGVPLHGRNYETYKRIAELCGELISMRANWNNGKSLGKIGMLLSIEQPF